MTSRLGWVRGGGEGGELSPGLSNRTQMSLKMPFGAKSNHQKGNFNKNDDEDSSEPTYFLYISMEQGLAGGTQAEQFLSHFL